MIPVPSQKQSLGKLNVRLRVANAPDETDARLQDVYELFPVLKDMLKPKLLIPDESTGGIQPSLIDQIENAILAIKKKGEVSIILVEQYIDFAP